MSVGCKWGRGRALDGCVEREAHACARAAPRYGVWIFRYAAAPVGAAQPPVASAVQPASCFLWVLQACVAHKHMCACGKSGPRTLRRRLCTGTVPPSCAWPLSVMGGSPQAGPAAGNCAGTTACAYPGAPCSHAPTLPVWCAPRAQTFDDSVNTCFEILLGEINVNEQLRQLGGLQAIAGAFFFWTYMLLVRPQRPVGSSCGSVCACVCVYS